MIRVFCLVSLLALTACDVAKDVATDTARSEAKGVVNGVVQSKFPGLNAAPVTDCIIDNASLSEIFKIAKAAVTGVDAATTELVVDISKRPDTINCMLKNSLNAFL